MLKVVVVSIRFGHEDNSCGYVDDCSTCGHGIYMSG